MQKVIKGTVAASVIPTEAAEVRAYRVSDQTGLAKEFRNMLSYTVRLYHNCFAFISQKL